MFVLGITGGIGCGKSTLAGLFKDAGVTVVDADAISRVVTAAGGTALPEIIEQFGPTFLSADGALDRTKMAAEVFSNRLAVDRLSEIVHRHVVGEIKRELNQGEKQKKDLLVLDVPIPIEDGFLQQCDFIAVVWASEEVRLERLQKRGMSKDEARRRMLMQMSEEEYRALADVVFYNDGDYQALKSFFDDLVKEQLTVRGISLPQQPVGR